MHYDVNHTTEVYLRDTAVTFSGKIMKRDKKVRYDVNHTTEVNLRDTAVTFLNKLMKRDKK